MYNQLILIFIIFIVILYFLNKYEHFSSEDKIVGNKDIFLPIMIYKIYKILKLIKFVLKIVMEK